MLSVHCAGTEPLQQAFQAPIYGYVQATAMHADSQGSASIDAADMAEPIFLATPGRAGEQIVVFRGKCCAAMQ